MQRPVGAMAIAVLALVQSLLGVLRAFHWFNIGSDLMGQGLLILPIIGVVAYVRGALVAVIALLYVVFALGLFTAKDWARALGIGVAVVNLLLVLSVVLQGESVLRAVFWMVVPVIILWYLFSPTGEPGRAISGKAK